MRYPIGTPGKPWQAAEKAAWLAQQTIQRSYFDEVVAPIMALADRFALTKYGTLDYCAHGASQYPLYSLQTQPHTPTRSTVLITGGVHGYETSGVHGALAFLDTLATDYGRHFNLLVAPCVSPWGYETINRWNPQTLDPNRCFVPQSPAPEAAALMAHLSTLGLSILAHVDLHETTDTDNSEFRPALAARDGVDHDNWNIPDGFYLVDDTTHPQPDFQRAIIDVVSKVTHIAKADAQGRLIGEPITQPGVIGYDTHRLGLCASITQAQYVTTTEVYPDSPNATPEQCVQAQVAAVRGALDFLQAQHINTKIA